MVVHWPTGIKARGEVRSQLLQAAGLPEPKAVNGTKQRPMDGVSMLYSFDNPRAKGRRTTQYFEMFGNRAIAHFQSCRFWEGLDPLVAHGTQT